MQKYNTFAIQRFGLASIDLQVFPAKVRKKYANYIQTHCPANAIVGICDDAVYIVSPFYDEFTKAWQFVRWCKIGEMQWHETMIHEIQNYIMYLNYNNKVILKKYRAPRVAKTLEQMKEYKEMVNAQSNREFVVRKSTKCMKNAGKDAQRSQMRKAVNTYGYQVLNYCKHGSVPTSIVEYLDGTGVNANFNNSDMRPQMPQFPEHSYKAK